MEEGLRNPQTQPAQWKCELCNIRFNDKVVCIKIELCDGGLLGLLFPGLHPVSTPILLLV